MNYIVLLLACLLGNQICAQPVVRPDPEKATLVIYRDFSTSNYVPDFHVNFNIWVNGQRICKLSDNRYLVYAIDPGPVNLQAKAAGFFLSKRRRFMTDVKVGQVYYISCYQRNDILFRWLEMTLVPYENSRARMTNMQADHCMERL